MTLDRNLTTYTAPDIVGYYAGLKKLQPAEATILDLLRSQVDNIKMLDIGVGGGRTTRHFAPVTAEYIGIDYSAGMIAACEEMFSGNANTTFKVCDARDLSRFEDGCFDFILFSFNGIDYISHTDRLQVFAEVRRIIKPGGYFYFSTHNLTGVKREFDFKQQLRFNPLKTYVNLVMFVFLHIFNFPIDLRKIQTSDYLILKDESHNFRLDTYYIRPQVQIDLLKSFFSNVCVYSWSNGREITGAQLQDSSDLWLYYLCQIDNDRSGQDTNL
jgi:ubiquinone/menaquinone biosynthesis C-methylase UbiE